MKILYIINSLRIRGAEKLVMDSILLLQKDGITADLAVLKHENTSFDSLFKSKTKDEMFELSKGSVYNPLLIFKIIPFLKKYDIIHVHLFPSLYWVVLAKWLSFSKTKIIYTEHSTHNRRRDSLIGKLLDKLIYKGVEIVITISEKVDYNLKHHLNNKKIKFQLIQNGIDVEYFHNALPYPKTNFFSENDFILIQVSGFVKAKDQPTLIKAMLHLPDRVKLLLVGDGELRQNCIQMVDRLNLKHRILFLGNRTDIARLLKSSDIILLASHYEGLSLSNIEGMSSGRPFIGSNVPGIKEIVENHGILFPENNSRALANHVKELMENSLLYEKIAAQCYRRAKDFDIKKMIDKYITLYIKLEKSK